MKKLLLLFFALLFTGTANVWADVSYTVSNPVQVTDLANLSPQKFYILQNSGSSRYNYYDTENSQMDAKTDYDYSSVVRLIYDGENVQIQQVCTSTYYQTLAQNTRLALGESPVDYTFNTSGVADGCFRFANNSCYMNRYSADTQYPMGAGTNLTGAFSQWKIYEVDVTTTWNSVDNWEHSSGGNANVNYFGIVAPGTNDDHFELSSFSIYTLNYGNSAQTRYAAIVEENPNSTTSVAASNVLAVSSNTVTANTEGYQEFTFSTPVSIMGGVTYYIVFLSSNTPTDGNYTQGQLRCGLYSTTYAPKTYWNTSGINTWAVGLTATLSKAIPTTINVTYALYESDGTTFVTSVVKPQEPNSDISIPSSLQNTTYFNYATEGTIGEEDCTIKVTRTLKNANIVYPISNLSNNKAYTLTTQRGSLGTNGTQMVSTYGTTYSASNFAIISYEENYYLYSVADSKFVSNNTQPTLTEDISEVSALTFDLTSAPLYFMGMGSNGVNVSSYNTGIVVNNWTNRDAGNQYVIEEADDFDPTDALAVLEEYFHPSYFVTYVVKDESGENTLFTSDPVGTTLGANITTLPEEYQQALFYDYNTVNVTISETNTTVTFTATPKDSPLFQYTADTTNPVYYVLKLKNATYPKYVSDGTPNVTLPTTISDYNNVVWAFVGEPYAGFQLINKAAGTSLVLGSESPASDGKTGGNTYATLASSGTQTYEKWYVVNSTHLTNGFFLCNEEGYALNQRSNDNLAYWTSGKDAGSTFTVNDIKDVYNSFITQIEDIDYGTSLGQYTLTGDLIGDAGNEAALISLIQDYAESGNYADGANAAQHMLDATKINMPNGKFIRLYNTTSNLYMGSASSGKHPMVESKDDAGIYYVTTDNHIVSYDQGLPLANAAGAPCTTAGNTGGAFTFGAVDYAGTYYVYCGGYIIAWTDKYTNRNSGYDNKANWNISEVTDLPLTISDAGYATLYSPVALTIPEGVTAYTGYIDGSVLKLEALSEKIPAETAVILQGEANDYTFTTTTADAFEGTNNLEGTIGGKASTADAILTLQNYNDKIGLFNYTGSTLQGFKAYLDKTNLPAEVHGLTFEFDTETAIQGLSLSEESGAIYNLAGQRVQKATKGLYIVNGRKVVIK